MNSPEHNSTSHTHSDDLQTPRKAFPHSQDSRIDQSSGKLQGRIHRDRNRRDNTIRDIARPVRSICIVLNYFHGRDAICMAFESHSSLEGLEGKLRSAGIDACENVDCLLEKSEHSRLDILSQALLPVTINRASLLLGGFECDVHRVQCCNNVSSDAVL